MIEIGDMLAEEKKEELKTQKTDKVEKPETSAPATAPVTPVPSAPAAVARPMPSRGKPRFAVVHVFSSKNDTIITATDLSGAETLSWASGGMVVKSDREEGKPYAAMQATLKIVSSLKDKGVTHVHVRIRAPGGNGSKTPGPGAQAVVRTIARSGLRIGKIEDVTPLPTDSMKRKGGRRGRRV